MGEAWFRWLQAQQIPFHQRIKCDTLVPNHWNRMMRIDALLGSLKPGQVYRLPGRRPVWGCFVHLSALRLENGEFLILATFGAPQDQAIEAYADRWQVETLFGCLKTRGFNFEDTRAFKVKGRGGAESASGQPRHGDGWDRGLVWAPSF